MRQEMKSLALRWMAELWQKGDTDAVDEMHAPGFTDRSPGGRKGDNEGFKTGIRDFYNAFSDFYATAEEVLVDEEAGKAVVVWSGTGTHLGAYLGVEPTGRRMTFRGIEILKIGNQKVTERWGEWDGMEVLRQLGLWNG